MLESYGVLNVITYAIGALALVLVPGPNSIYVFKTSIQQGERRAMQAAAAVVLGDALLIFLAYIGIASLLQTHPALFDAVRLGGAAYLAYLGLSTLWDTYRKKNAKQAEGHAIKEASSPFKTSLIISLANPKAILFYVSFFVQFIDPTYPDAWVPYLILAGILQVFNIAYMMALCFAGQRIVNFAGSSPILCKLGNTMVGSLFLGFAGKLASL